MHTYYLDKEFNDLVFENRNKSYGAYFLRQKYTQYIGKGFLFAITILALIVVSLMIQSKFFNNDKVYDADFDVKIVELPPLDEIEETKLPLIQHGETTPQHEEIIEQQQPEEIVTSKIVEDPKVKELPKTIVDTLSKKDDPAKEPTATAKGSETGTGESPAGSKLNGVDGEKIVNIPQRMPQFPGGKKGLADYIKNNLKYPLQAQAKKIEGVVKLSFVVGKDGNIYEIKVEQSLGYGCDDAAITMIKAMPKWEPGLYNNLPVHVRYYLPISFNLTK